MTFISSSLGFSAPDLRGLQLPPRILPSQFYGPPKQKAELPPLRAYPDIFAKGPKVVGDFKAQIAKDPRLYLRWFTDRHGVHPLQFFLYMERYLGLGADGVNISKEKLLDELGPVLLYRHEILGESEAFLSSVFGIDLQKLQRHLRYLRRSTSVRSTIAARAQNYRFLGPLLMHSGDLPATGYYEISEDGVLVHGEHPHSAWFLPSVPRQDDGEEEPWPLDEREDEDYNEFDEQETLTRLTETASAGFVYGRNAWVLEPSELDESDTD